MKKSIFDTYKTGHLFLFLLSFIFITSCKSRKISEAKETSILTIKLLQVNDVYEIAPLSGGKYGGMARVGYIADSIKNKFPHSYLVMAGDFLNPSLLGTLKVDGQRVKGKQMIEVMNAMNFDLATFGNHEFDLKQNELQERLNESNFQWTSANVFEKKGEDLNVFKVVKNGDTIPIPETVFYDIDIGKEARVRVGFFSVTVDSNPVPYVFYADYQLETRTAVSALEGAASDIIIGLTHLSIEQDIKVANANPEIDFIMGGHEHNAMYVETQGATVAKADANAKSMYVHTILYNTMTDRMTIESDLVFIDDKVPSLPAVQSIVDRWNGILDTEIKQVISDPNEVVYVSNIPLDGTDSAGRSVQTNLGAIITQAMAEGWEEPTSLAIVNGGSFRLDDMLPTQVTAIDIFRVLPFGGDVLKVDVTGALLTQVLDYGEEQRGTGAYLHRYGFAQNAAGEWLANNQPIDPLKTYTVAFSDFLLKGYDVPFLKEDNPGVLKIVKAKNTEPAIDIRKAVITFMKSKN